ncbi:hypothetical protein TUM17387_08000 [Shewanella carassii]|nr:hypothetical protein TUM17387_08000 [Shewanella carassii]
MFYKDFNFYQKNSSWNAEFTTAQCSSKLATYTKYFAVNKPKKNKISELITRKYRQGSELIR